MSRSEIRIPITAPRWVRDGFVYEAFPRCHGPRGTLDDVIDDLDRLRTLGVRTLWLMPVHPIGCERRKGTWGSPYAVRDYTRVDPLLGGDDALIRLVERAHDRSIRVIVDWVANHAAWDNTLRERHPDWFRRNAAGRRHPPVPDWDDVIDLDYRSRALREYMSACMIDWVRLFDLDGFRCDVAAMIPMDFWRETIARADMVKRDLFWLAEAEGRIVHDRAFHATYDWSLYGALVEVARGRRPAADVARVVARSERELPEGALRLSFVENHDKTRAVSVFGLRRARAAFVLTMFLPGLPLVYAGQERGAEGWTSIFERGPIDGGDAEWESEVARLAAVRSASPALAAGSFRPLATTEPRSLVAFERAGAGERIVCVANLGSRPAALVLEDAAGGRDLMTDTTMTLDPGRPAVLAPDEVIAVRLGVS